MGEHDEALQRGEAGGQIREAVHFGAGLPRDGGVELLHGQPRGEQHERGLHDEEGCQPLAGGEGREGRPAETGECARRSSSAAARRSPYRNQARRNRSSPRDKASYQDVHTGSTSTGKERCARRLARKSSHSETFSERPTKTLRT